MDLGKCWSPWSVINVNICASLKQILQKVVSNHLPRLLPPGLSCLGSGHSFPFALAIRPSGGGLNLFKPPHWLHSGREGEMLSGPCFYSDSGTLNALSSSGAGDWLSADVCRAARAALRRNGHCILHNVYRGPGLLQRHTKAGRRSQECHNARDFTLFNCSCKVEIT